MRCRGRWVRAVGAIGLACLTAGLLAWQLHASQLISVTPRVLVPAKVPPPQQPRGEALAPAAPATPVLLRRDLDQWEAAFANISSSVTKPINVEVWGKAAIGTYLVEHVLGSSLQPMLGGIWHLAKAHCGPLRLTYRSGVGVVPHKVPKTAEHVILVLNGHNDEKVPSALPWLESLLTLPKLQNVGLLVLGYEDCSNNWLERFIADPRFKIRFLFLVYGGHRWLAETRVKVLQWPLGVATYRNFPLQLPYYDALGPSLQSHQRGRRQWLCNLQATIYPNSSRTELLEVLHEHGLAQHCFIEARTEWQPNESEDSRARYQQMLLASDFTLAPAGLNTECYRWYEAAAAGSIPIVEDRIQPVSCAQDPLQLIKASEAPFLYVRSWKELPALLRAQSYRSPESLVDHRRRLVQWYADFKMGMRHRFCATVTEAFAPRPSALNTKS